MCYYNKLMATFTYFLSSLLLLDLFEFGPKFSKSITDAGVDYKTTKTHTSLNLALSFQNTVFDYYKDDTNGVYVPLYITIKPLGYQSLISISFEFGNYFNYYSKYLHAIDMGDPLTLKNTQYVPQLKKEEELTTN